MGDSSTTTTDLDQTDEDVLTYTVSDEGHEPRPSHGDGVAGSCESGAQEKQTD
jgi:hypothetical protein